MKNRVFNVSLLILVMLFGALSVLNAASDRSGAKKPSKIYKASSTLEGGAKGDAWAISINNIHLPYNRKGIIADVNFEPWGSLGKYPGPSGKGFLFSSGFWLSGYRNGELFANAVASASLVEDYIQGPVGGANDSRSQIYVVQSEDPPFGAAWQDWSKAVELGADFYDGDGDGVYNPQDRNGNGEWDPDEDRPDLIGDELGWTVFNDGVESGSRRWNTIDPIGIEVRQSIFGFASSGSIGNIVFVRFRFTYVGLGKADDPDELTNVYFGVWADPDIGGTASAAADDLVGSDIERNAGYVFNDGEDDDWGSNPPAFVIDFFSGPVAYIPDTTFTDVDGDGEYTDGVDTPLDTAYSIRGQVLGIEEYPGAKNLGLSSFIHYMNDNASIIPDPNTAEYARNYMEGKMGPSGEVPDPCDWAFGEVLGGVDCATVDARYWYSGDPVTRVGWITTSPQDQRMLSNTGPFVLKKGEEKEVLVAYVVGQGSDALNSITEARRIDDGAQFIFDINFLSPGPPPAVKPTIATSDNFIDLVWDTHTQVNFTDKTEAWDNRFEGYFVYAYRTASNQEKIGNEPNRMLYKAYDLDNDIANIYIENNQTGGLDLLYSETSNKLDPEIYGDPNLGRIRLRITKDPFTGGDLIKGKPYYFAIVSYAINYDALVNKETGTPGLSGYGDYYLTTSGFTQNVENIPQILSGDGVSPGIIVGEDIYAPPVPLTPSNLVSGYSTGLVTYDVVDKQALTGDTYQVTFTIDSSDFGEYAPFWTLKDKTKGITLIDSSKEYLYGQEDVAMEDIDGFIMRIKKEPPTPAPMVGETAQSWYHPDSVKAHYIVGDNAQAVPLPGSVPQLGGKLSTYTKSDKLRRIELRFEPGKAYRYVNGVVGSAATRERFYLYAEAVTADDTAGSGFKKLGEGFVDVPFTAWVQDPVVGEERQLTVGFIEKSKALGGNPDGVWDPDTNISISGEYIVIFNEDYDPNGNQLVYKGGAWEGPRGTVWADLQGGDRFYPVDDSPLSTEDRKKAASAYFDGLYVIALEKSSPNRFYTQGDKFVIDVLKYPFTPSDVYEFTTVSGGELSSADQKEIFDRVNVFPNPLFGFNPATSWTGQNTPPDQPFVTFSNLPEEITIKIYSLSGQLLRTLSTSDKDSPTSPYLRWDLTNESGLRVASGLYLAIVSSPKYGDKILKFSIIMPQKQLQKY